MIVAYEPYHRPALVETCYRTGFYGKDLTGAGLFMDREAFALCFCLHYPTVAPDLAFVALNPERKPVGYIIGTTDTAAQKADYVKTWLPRLKRHLLFNTFWSSKEDFDKMWGWAATRRKPQLDAGLLADYPAHLHINLLPEAQGLGLGTQLMTTFLNKLREKGVQGVHLGTNSANEKAVPFYKKQGFTVLSETPSDMWNTGKPLNSLIFGLKL